MIELKSDKTKVVIEKKDNEPSGVLVTRTIVERYDPVDYINAMERMDLQLGRLEDDQSNIKDMINKMKLDENGKEVRKIMEEAQKRLNKTEKTK